MQCVLLSFPTAVGLVRHHCGVLGLAALVQSCPDTVPDWLPAVLDELTLHLNDPAPIPVSVPLLLLLPH